MERVISQDERIRRAEELYARRKMQNTTKTSATVNVDSTNSNKIAQKMIVQFIVCMLIYATFYAVKNIPNFVPQDVMYKISDILEYDINIQELYNTYVKNNENVSEKQNIQESQEGEANFIQDTLSATDSIENLAVEVVQQAEIPTEEPSTQVEDTSNLTQMEIDAKYVLENYSIIKPLEGEITSRFGNRESSNPIVSKFHTGIDIARVTGTVIIAAMDGTVVEASGEGCYGNHIIIKNGEIETLYAHCSKLYVENGAQITQGTAIAEVGATGNATGPHLHFEVIRNGEYIDPDLILQF